MSRNRTIDYAAFDVQILNDHVNTASYLNLFKYFFTKTNRREIPLKNNTYLTIQMISYLNEDQPEDGFIGKIIKWDGPTVNYFNDETGQPANPKDIESFKTPEHLKANPRLFNFVFYPKQHKLICEISEQDNIISENVLLEFLRHLLGDTGELKQQFGRIEVLLVHEVDTIENILNNKTLVKVHLEINRPEGEKLSVAEQEIVKLMDSQNISKYQKIVDSDKGNYISLSEEMKKEMRIATMNGYVAYKSHNDQGYVVNKSTATTHPLIIKEPYDPDLTQAYYVIQQVGVSFLKKHK